MPNYSVNLNVGPAKRAIAAGAEDGMKLAVEHLLTEANKHVPHDEGTLERSGDTGVSTGGDGVKGSVSYDTPYAVRQHEDLTLNHSGKGNSKWLENTMGEEAQTLGRIIATATRRQVGS